LVEFASATALIFLNHFLLEFIEFWESEFSTFSIINYNFHQLFIF